MSSYIASQLDVNEDAGSTYRNLSKEQDPHVVAGLLWEWLDHLKEPVLHPQDMPQMLEHSSDPHTGLSMLEKVSSVIIPQGSIQVDGQGA